MALGMHGSVALAAEEAPQVRQHGGVAYVMAGDAAGRAEAERLSGDMNLALTFARAPRGEPLSDVALVITDSHGQTVLDLASVDPSLRARLVPGVYQVSATVHGQTLRRRVEVPRQGTHTEAFEWSDSTPMRLIDRP